MVELWPAINMTVLISCNYIYDSLAYQNFLELHLNSKNQGHGIMSIIWYVFMDSIDSSYINNHTNSNHDLLHIRYDLHLQYYHKTSVKP